MSAAVPLRPDFSADTLRRLARTSRDAGQSRRLLVLTVIYDGGHRSDASRVGAVGLQTVRDRVLAFNADGPAGLVDGKSPGQRPKLDDPGSLCALATGFIAGWRCPQPIRSNVGLLQPCAPKRTERFRPAQAIERPDSSAPNHAVPEDQRRSS